MIKIIEQPEKKGTKKDTKKETKEETIKGTEKSEGIIVLRADRLNEDKWDRTKRIEFLKS